MSDEPKQVEQNVTGQGILASAGGQHIGELHQHFHGPAAPSAALPWSLPTRAAGFAGRVEDLVTVAGLLEKERCVALTGPGGMGKTALAAEVIYQLAPAPGPRCRWPGGIYSHDYYRESGHQNALSGLLGQAGIDLRQVTDATGEVRRLFSQPGVLLYLEGCEKAADLTALLDLTGRAQVLLTTRAKVQRGDAHAFEVQPLDEKSAAQLLRHHAQQPKLPDLPANPAPTTPANPTAGLPRPVRHERGEGRGEGLPNQQFALGSPEPPQTSQVDGRKIKGRKIIPSNFPAPNFPAKSSVHADGSPTTADAPAETEHLLSPALSSIPNGGEGDGARGAREVHLRLLVQQHPEWIPWLKLAQELGGHPLALRLAGAWMHDQHESPEEFAASQATERFGDWTQRDQRKDNLHRLFGHSADAVVGKHPLALEVWYALALHGHAPVPLPVLCACVEQPEADVRKALAALVNYSLAERGNFPAETIGQTEPAWQLTHALLGEWGRNRLGGLAPLSPEKAGDLGLPRPVRHERGEGRGEGSPTDAERLLSPTLSSVPNGGEGAPRQLSPARCEAIFDAWLLWWHGQLDQQRAVVGGPDRYLAVQPHWQSLRDLTERIAGEQSQEQANVLVKLAIAHQFMGKFLLAEPLYRQGLAVCERVQGAEHPATLGIVNNLAELLRAKGDLAGAEALYRRGLEGCERMLGVEHPTTLTCVNNLALLLKTKGDLAGAESLYRRALAVRERELGAEHPATLGSVNNLAALLADKGNLAGAEPLYRRALEGRERVLGAEHPRTLTSVNNLALLLKTKGDLVGAEPLYRRALAVRERELGAEHPDTLISVNNLAELLRAKGDLAGAEPLHRRVLEVSERVLGAEHPDTLISVVNLAGLRQAQGRLEEAERLVVQAEKGFGTQLGAEHPHTKNAKNWLDLIRKERAAKAGGK